MEFLPTLSQVTQHLPSAWGAPHPTGHPHEALVRVRGDVTGKGEGHPTFLPTALGRGAAVAGPALGSRLGQTPAPVGPSSRQAGCFAGEGNGGGSPPGGGSLSSQCGERGCAGTQRPHWWDLSSGTPAISYPHTSSKCRRCRVPAAATCSSGRQPFRTTAHHLDQWVM